MSGESAVAGPEVDMAEMEPISSSSSSFGVDLDLNLGSSFALDLALGRGGGAEEQQEEEEGRNASTTTITTPPHVSRPNWSRFEPGMLAGGQEEEEENLIRVEPISSSSSSMVTNETDHRRHGFRHGISTSGHDDTNHGGDGEEGSSSQSPPLALRNPRFTRLPRRPRQALFTSLLNPVETPVSSDQGSTTENRVVLEVAETSIPQGSFLGARTPRIQNSPLEITVSNENSNQEENNNNNNNNNKFQRSNSGGIHFECNICLEMAVEPVVTCCGHLFCWPCLHEWLHLHASQKECPVCKGFLSDDVITPIYGRGTSEAGDSTNGHNNTPPRPHAHRINGKRRSQGRSNHERSQTVSENMESGVSHNASGASAELLILNRLRIAQRLQREHLDERLRLRLRQRMMGRRGSAFRSLSGLESATRAMVSPVPSRDFSRQVQNLPFENMVGQVQNQPFENMGGGELQNQSLENTGEQVRALPGENTDEGLIRNTMERSRGMLSPHQSFDEERSDIIGTRSYYSPSNGSDLRLSTPELPVLETVTPERGQIAFRSWQRQDTESENASPVLPQQQSWRLGLNNSSSSSFDVEPESLHARKRRRLN